MAELLPDLEERVEVATLEGGSESLEVVFLEGHVLPLATDKKRCSATNHRSRRKGEGRLTR